MFLSIPGFQPLAALTSATSDMGLMAGIAPALRWCVWGRLPRVVQQLDGLFVIAQAAALDLPLPSHPYTVGTDAGTTNK